MDQRTKRTLWIAAGVVFVVALVVHHNITEQEIIIFCVMVPSIILHEISHGWVAKLFGDDTAKRAGRLTLNPVPHVDPVGTLIVPALLSLGSVGFFGWAKPVPVNMAKLRSPRNQGVLVSLAGPATNAVLAAVFGLVFVHFVRASVRSFRGRFVDRGPDRLLRRPGQRGPVRLQPDPGPAARRLRAVVERLLPAR